MSSNARQTEIQTFHAAVTELKHAFKQGQAKMEEIVSCVAQAQSLPAGGNKIRSFACKNFEALSSDRPGEKCFSFRLELAQIDLLQRVKMNCDGCNVKNRKAAERSADAASKTHVIAT